MSDLRDTIPNLTDTEKKPTGKRELLRDGTYQLIVEASKKMDAIKKARDAERNDLLQQIEQSKALEQDDLKGCEIQLAKDVAALREAIFGRGEQPLALMRKLPVEVLSYIFRYYVESGQSPWSLTRICNAWTRVALGTPHLWTHLLFPSTTRFTNVEGYQEHVLNGEKQLSIDKWQVCLGIEDMDAAVQRSGAALPLTLKFERQEWAEHKASKEALVRFISSPLSERVGSLDLERFSFRNTNFAADMSVGAFPVLKEIMVQLYHEQRISILLKAVASTSSCLEAATFRGNISEGVASYSFWTRLKWLRLDSQYNRFPGVNLVTPTLSALEQLEHFSLSWPNEETLVSTWTNIREITLYCDPIHLSRLRLPRLESLTYLPGGHHYHGNVHSLSEYGDLSYPMLHSLELHTTDPRWPEYTSSAFKTVENLKIIRGGDDGMLIATLQTMPNVRNLHLLNTTSRQEVGLRLLRELQSSDEPLLCPQLESLHIGDPNGLVTQKSKCAPLVRSLVDFREQVGKPLRELIVHWKHRQEITDYVVSAV